MIHKFTSDGPMLGSMSTVPPVKAILLQCGETQARNLIILHETLFPKDILHFFDVYRHVHDKSDGCKYDLRKSCKYDLRKRNEIERPPE